MAGVKITEYRCDGYGCGSRAAFRAGPAAVKDAHAAGWVSWVRNGRGVDLCPSCDAALDKLMRGEQPALELDGPAELDDSSTTSYDDVEAPAPAGVVA